MRLLLQKIKIINGNFYVKKIKNKKDYILVNMRETRFDYFEIKLKIFNIYHIKNNDNLENIFKKNNYKDYVYDIDIEYDKDNEEDYNDENNEEDDNFLGENMEYIIYYNKGIVKNKDKLTNKKNKNTKRKNNEKRKLCIPKNIKK